MDDAQLVAQLAAVSRELRNRPAQRLIPFSSQIGEINTEISLVAASISRQLSPASASSSQIMASSEDQGFQNTRADDFGNYSGQQRQAHPLEDILAVTVRNIPSLLRAIQYVHSQNIVFTEEARLSHVQLIFEFQGVAMPPDERIRNKFQLMLGCWSLAQDFRAFEKSQRWTPKMDILIKRALNCNDAVSQQPIGRHLSSFLTQYSSVFEEQQSKLDASIRFGIKLHLLVEIGMLLGLGAGLSLLMGFEGYKISRMKFDDLPQIKTILEQNLVDTKAVRDFCNQTSAWWESTLINYHKYYELLPSKAGNMRAFKIHPSSSPSENSRPPRSVPVSRQASIAPQTDWMPTTTAFPLGHLHAFDPSQSPYQSTIAYSDVADDDFDLSGHLQM